MICPKCGESEDIKFFVRHCKTSDDDESTTANALTILHATPQCGFNETYILEDILDVVFPNWSEVVKMEEQLNEIENNTGAFGAMMSEMFTANDIIETEGEIIEDEKDENEIFGECESCQLPPIQEEEEVEKEIEEEVIDGVEVEDE